MDQAPDAPLELILKHDSRSIVGQLTMSPDLDSYRFAYAIEGEPTPRSIRLPKKLFRGDLVKGVQTIVTITITQCGLVPQLPPGLNGQELGH